jgi:hypothetical protein
MWYCVYFKTVWHDPKEHKVIETVQVISFEKVVEREGYYFCYDGASCAMSIGKSQVIRIEHD